MDAGQSICLTFGSLAMIGAVIARMWFAHEERKLKIKAQGQNTGTNTSQPEFEALRQELARLRDTSTQYDISIQNSLEELQRRVESLESHRRASIAPAGVVKEEKAIAAVNRSA